MQEIKRLEMLPDEQMFQFGWQPKDIQEHLLHTQRHEIDYRTAYLFAQLAFVSKLFINYGRRFEELLTQEGMISVSNAVYALEWKKFFYETEQRHKQLASQGYWRRLWNALLNK